MQVVEASLSFCRDEPVDEDRPHINLFFFKQRLDHGKSIHRVTQSTAGNQEHRGVQQAGDAGVGQLDNGADSGMPQPFNDDEVALLFQFGIGLLDLFLEVSGGDKSIDNLVGGVGREDHGGHQPQVLIQSKDLGHQRGVFVNNHPTISFYAAFGSLVQTRSSRSPSKRSGCRRMPVRRPVAGATTLVWTLPLKLS